MNNIGFIDDDIKTSNIIEYYNIRYAADKTIKEAFYNASIKLILG